MEIEVPGDPSIVLNLGQKKEIGRGSGIKTDDRTVSRRHVSFELPLSSDESKVRFEVTGKNPIWICSSKSGEVSLFGSSQAGEMEAGDMFCVSAKNPVWFTLRKKAEFGGKRDENGGEELGSAYNLEERCELIDGRDFEPESVDISTIDPVKEFGFLVMGHEFDRYAKKMIREMKDWDWFLEEPGVGGSEDDEVGRRKKSGRRKRKKGVENDDDEWTGESEEEKEQIITTPKVPRPKYSTRSKDRGKPGKNARKDKHATRKDRSIEEEEEEDDEDESDETLGGFIVDDKEEDVEETNGEEEEEDFEEDDDEDD